MAKLEHFLTVRNLTKRYGANGDGAGFLALSNINLNFAEHEFVSIVGKSGCGKSTLLRMIAGLVSCEEGEIALQSSRITGPSAERGLVFQEYVLFPWRSVTENIGFGLEMKGIPAKQRAEMVAHFVSLVGLNGFENAFPSALSGGMRQRVAIAAVLANDPKVLLMDEPFGALDAQTRLSLQRELTRIWQSTKKCAVMVTHSVEEAIYLSQRIIVMKSNPGEIEDVVEVPLAYPRDVTSPEFNKLKGLLLDKLHDRESSGINGHVLGYA